MAVLHFFSCRVKQKTNVIHSEIEIFFADDAQT